MNGFGIKIIERPPIEKILKNIDFGTATGLTKTAQDGQKAVRGALKGTFTMRTNWDQPAGRFGIRIKTAKRDDLSAEVRTQADWLIPHETGEDKKARGGRVAVPTENVRRNKRMIIPKAQRPAALRGKRTFVVKTRRGDVIFQRKYKGKRSRIEAIYGLERSVKIKKQSTFNEPITKVVNRRLLANIETGIHKALSTMRPGKT